MKSKNKHTAFRFFRFTISKGSDARKIEVLAESFEAAKIAVGTMPGERVVRQKVSDFEQALGLRLNAQRVSYSEKSKFFKNLSKFLAVGTSLNDALKIAAPLQKSPFFKGVIGGVSERMNRHGEDFSTAAARYPEAFSRIDKHLLKVGERSGELATIFKNLSVEYSDAILLNKKIKKALTYPAVMGALMLIAIFFINTQVLPNLLGSFSAMGAKTPKSTQVLMDVSTLLRDYSVHILGTLAGITFIAIKLREKIQSNSLFQKIAIKAPIIGRLNRGIILSRTLGVLAIMVNSGIRFQDAFKLAIDLSINKTYEDYYKAILLNIENGDNIDSAFMSERARIGDDGLEIASQLRVGTFTGDPASVLDDIAVDRKEMVKDYADVLPSVMVPLINGIFATVGGGVVIAVFVPMISVITSLTSGG